MNEKHTFYQNLCLLYSENDAHITRRLEPDISTRIGLSDLGIDPQLEFALTKTIDTIRGHERRLHPSLQNNDDSQWMVYNFDKK